MLTLKKKIFAATLIIASLAAQTYSVVSAQTANSTSTTVVNTGTNQGVAGNGNFQGNGVAIGGNNNGNVNTNSNSTGSNVNNVYVPSGGGSSAIILPRNPLTLMTPQNTGQSVFGFQAGVQNNPYPTSIGTMGGTSALGWFAQGGVTIPFGKIPSILRNNSNTADDARQLGLDQDRNVFGQLTPQQQQQSVQAQTNVKGQIIGMNAYSYATTPAGKINMPGSIDLGGKETPYQPKLLALAPGDVYTRPLNTGEKAGVVEVGKEYPYLGHIRAQGKQPAWIKILMPDGTQGWVSSRFEFVKTDYTEVDDLAVASPAKEAKVSSSKHSEHVNKRRISLR